MPFRTGYENVVANRAEDRYAIKAIDNGIIKKVTDDLLTVEYKDQIINYELGTFHGLMSGEIIPHKIICDLAEGKRVKKGDVIAFNSGFFERNLLNPSTVDLKFGRLTRIAFHEVSDVDEDGCVIRESLTQDLTTRIGHVRDVVVDFNTHVYNLVHAGDEIDADSILCTLEESFSDTFSESDEEAVAALSAISASNPRAGHSGKIAKIEVLYYGDIENMTPSLQAIVKEDNKRRAKRSKLLGEHIAKTGQIDEMIRVGGVKMDKGMVAIRVFIDDDLGIGSGDKFVISNALKTTVSYVDVNPIVSEDGQDVEIVFGANSAANRIVGSYLIQGLGNLAMTEISKQMADIYFNN